ncbi:methionyl-tRNA formyltransferase [Desulfobacula phenolica]|uniref:Methionyl-tRNA formyltransferase n=1 Tax=Desulfobacula phenolica TaxID=90732 RepID=A0A1H2DQ51_9BACT|nr:methionyl-tRNA formyltransferase [Desulfobacula phenolica]SDT84881.1 methionyl-tRNA formyltransferase [Desulfobacula phenolica]
MKQKIRVIYMGTPDFSVPALQHLAAQDDFHISLVVTQPDRPKGRGKKLAPSPVKTAALELGLDVFQPEKINTQEAKDKLLSLQPDFFVVAAFGQILSQEILDIPKVYPINIHASLLPKYRGASPIQASILNMDEITGVTTMVMAKGMDTGDILLTSETPISEHDTAQDIHDRLGEIGADLIVKTIHAILDNRLKPMPQDHSKATNVKMLKKSDGKINWNLSNRQIRAHINAMTPWPGAFTHLENKLIKIYTAKTSDKPVNHEPGVIFQCDKEGIHVTTGNGCLTILELMGSSGKRLKAMDFLCGHKIDPPVKFDL